MVHLEIIFFIQKILIVITLRILILRGGDIINSAVINSDYVDFGVALLSSFSE